MTFPIQLDDNQDPYLFAPGDMGSFQTVITGRNAVTGNDLIARVVIRGTVKFTGGKNVDGSPTVALLHPPINPEDVPADYPWPTATLGPDPR